MGRFHSQPLNSHRCTVISQLFFDKFSQMQHNSASTNLNCKGIEKSVIFGLSYFLTAASAGSTEELFRICFLRSGTVTGVHAHLEDQVDRDFDFVACLTCRGLRRRTASAE